MPKSKVTTDSIQNEYSDIKHKMSDFLREAKDYRAVWEFRSFVNEKFYQGDHYVKYDRKTKQIVTVPKKSDNDFVIQKVRKTVRGIKTMITKNEPRWHVKKVRYGMDGELISDEEKKVAINILRHKYKEEHIKDKLKDLLTHSIVKTTAWMYVGYDNSKEDMDIFVEDPFNIYTSPDGKLEGPVFVGKYIIRTIRKSLSDIKTSPLYTESKFKNDLDKLTPESKQSESSENDQILSDQYKIPTNENGSVILKELYVLEEVGKKVSPLERIVSSEEKQLYRNEKSRVRIYTMVGDIIIRDELTEYNQFPFLAYQVERDKGYLYSPSWIEPIIELNRSLNEGYSNRADWLDQFAKGRYMMKKGSKMSVLKGRNAQIVEYEGSRPEMMDRGNLPQEVNIHLAETERYIEDIGGIHSESTGRASGSQMSGVAIAQLQAADNNNVSEPVDNLKTFMEELAYRMLDIASKFYPLQRMEVDTLGLTNILGSEVMEEVSELTGNDFQSEVVKIKPLRNIEVEIIPGSAFSDMQTRSDLLELRSLGVQIPDEMIIEAYKLGDTQRIMDAYKEEQDEKVKDESGIEGLEASQAELENQKMMRGVQIAVQKGENHMIHLAVHGALLKEFRDSPEIAMLIQNHMMQHEALLQGDERIPQEEPAGGMPQEGGEMPMPYGMNIGQGQGPFGTA